MERILVIFTRQKDVIDHVIFSCQWTDAQDPEDAASG